MQQPVQAAVGESADRADPSSQLPCETLPAVLPATAAALATAADKSSPTSSVEHLEFDLGACNAPRAATAGNAVQQAGQLMPAIPTSPGTPPHTALHARAGASGDDAGRRLARLHRFAAYCSTLLGRELLPAEQAGSAPFEVLAAALTERLGAAALGDLSDGRDEWQRLAGLLSFAAGTWVSVQSVEEDLFLPPLPGRPDNRAGRGGQTSCACMPLVSAAVWAASPPHAHVCLWCS